MANFDILNTNTSKHFSIVFLLLLFLVKEASSADQTHPKAYLSYIIFRLILIRVGKNHKDDKSLSSNIIISSMFELKNTD